MFRVFLICLSILAIILFLLFVTRQVTEKFAKNYIVFVDVDSIRSIIDDSLFFDRMKDPDLFARKVASKEAYRKKYKNRIESFSRKEKENLNELISVLLKVERNQSKKLKDIPWKFAKISPEIENGWPHTLGDTIMLSSDFFKSSYDSQLDTLLHEKIHIYQRMYPIQTHELILKWGFQVETTFDRISLSRNNPDINNFVYSKNGKVIAQIYTSTTPINISSSYVANMSDPDRPQIINQTDINIPMQITQYEHPYEIMGSFLPMLLLKKNIQNDDFTKTTLNWIKSNL